MPAAARAPSGGRPWRGVFPEDEKCDVNLYVASEYPNLGLRALAAHHVACDAESRDLFSCLMGVEWGHVYTESDVT